MIIIHGSDTVSSRKYFFELKSKEINAVLLDGSSLTLTNLAQALQGQGLFGEKSALFIDELLSKKKASKELDAILDYLVSQKDATSVMWESKDLTSKQISSLKSATIKQFKLPTSLFAFLDSIYPGNAKQMLTSFHKVVEEQEVEMVFFMLVRQMRMLLYVQEYYPHPAPLPAKQGEGNQGISEAMRLAPWQKSKLEKQAKLFRQELLLKVYADLFTIEQQVKTGTLSQPLVSTIDFFLASL